MPNVFANSAIACRRKYAFNLRSVACMFSSVSFAFVESKGPHITLLGLGKCNDRMQT